jgi:hypothetical protein
VGATYFPSPLLRSRGESVLFGPILRSQRIDHFEKREPIEIGVSRADSPNAVLAHEDGRVRIVEYIAGQMRQLEITSPATSACRLVGTSTSKPGEASNVVTKLHAIAALEGRGITRGWVVTRRNSYMIGQVVYQTSGRTR